MSLYNLIFKRDKYKNPAKLTGKNIKGYLQGNIRQLLALTDIMKPEPHILEQTQYRLHEVSLRSPECLTDDGCKHCGCNIPDKVFEDRACEGDCYPEMMNSKDWNDFKLKNNINVKDSK